MRRSKPGAPIAEQETLDRQAGTSAVAKAPTFTPVQDHSSGIFKGPLLRAPEDDAFFGTGSSHADPASGNSKVLHPTLGELMILFEESAAYHRDPDVQSLLRRAAQSVGVIEGKLEKAAGRFVVAIVGLSDIGNTQLLLRLLGKNYVPTEDFKWPRYPVEIQYGPTPKLLAFKGSAATTRRILRAASLPDIYQRLDAIAESGQIDSGEGFDRLMIELPSSLLRGGLVLSFVSISGQQSSSTDASGDKKEPRYLTDDATHVILCLNVVQGTIEPQMVDIPDSKWANAVDEILVKGYADWDARICARFQKSCAAVFASRLPLFHYITATTRSLLSKVARSEAWKISASPFWLARSAN